MPGPTPTGNVLVLYGHGAVTDNTFDFRRADNHKINLYAWTREGIAVWDIQIELAANDAIAKGTIRDSYAAVNSSRIGGTTRKDYLIGPPNGLRLPTIPAPYGNTTIAALGANVHHNAATIAGSNRMVLMVNAGQPPILLSTIIYDPNFNARPLDILWCACKTEI
jgi:hypothetical protein